MRISDWSSDVCSSDLRLGDRPVDGQRRIVPADAGVGFAVVGFGAQVGEGRLLAEHRETMREAFRDPEMPSVFGRQQDGFPLAEGRRTAADVDGDVPDLRSEEHTSELQSLMRISYA